MRLLRDVPLTGLTTLEVGGPAALVAEVTNTDEVRRALDEAGGRPVFVLGGGSNVLVSDAGFGGLVLRPRFEGLTFADEGDRVRVHCGAGVAWDALVEATVQRDLAGLECLSGIPGLVGAAPIQNVGAYGQEVCETIDRVHAVRLHDGAPASFTGAECGFGYRWSRFKGEDAGRYLITAVELLLTPGGAPAVRYAQLAEGLGGPASLSEVRDTVIALRRGKSMVLDPADDNRRSAGSFFLNPVIDADLAAEVGALAGPELPRWPAGDQVKLAAAWLIEQAGFAKGYRRGRAGLSTRHTLALTNRGGASAEELLALAREIRQGVHERFGVWLWPEPVLLGFDAPLEELLA